MLRPRLKQVMYPVVLPGGRIQLGLNQYGMAAQVQDEPDGALERLLVLLDGTRDVDAVLRDFAATHPDWDAASVGATVEDLADAGFLEDAGAAVPAVLSEREAERYRTPRHWYGWIDTSARSSPFEVQGRLKESAVTVFGVGGTGSAVAAGLVAAGVGALHVVDFDVVEESNLTRQLLFRESDIGRSKVDVTVERLSALNSFCRVTGEDREITGPDDLAELMAGCDVFAHCADTPVRTVQYWTNEAALRTSTPWFMAIYDGPTMAVCSLVPGETGCWACLRREQDASEFVADARPLADWPPTAVVPASANVPGHLCALEICYHLGGLPTQVRGRVFRFNLGSWENQYFVDVPHFADCPACGTGTSPAGATG